jgi:hypothetical protein
MVAQHRIEFLSLWSGLPDFPCHIVPKAGENIPNCHLGNYQMAIKYTKWPQNIPNGCNKFKMAKEYTKRFHSKAL